MKRLSTLAWSIAVALGASTMAAAEFDGDFALIQGQWVNGELAEGNRQGITFDYISTSEVLYVAWYTYQSMPMPPAFDDVGALDNRWMTAQLGITSNGTSAAGTIYASSGGQFDGPNTGSQPTVAVGTMTIEFLECDLGMVTYELDSGLSGEFGIIPLEKSVNPGVFECETRQSPSQGPADEFNLLAVTDPELISLAAEVQDIEFGNWSEVPVFYPNQASYEWIGGRNVARTNPQVPHFGGDVMSSGSACVQCHSGYVPVSLSSPDVGQSFDPGFDKPSQINVSVRAAFTSDKLFVHVQHQSNTDAQGQNAADKQEGPGYTHQTYRFNGEGFGDRGIPKESGPDGTFTGTYDTLGNRRFNYEDRVALMMVPAASNLTDPNGARFNSVGCFMACHDDMRNMPADGLADISADPVLGSAGMGRTDMRHYILNSRANVTNTSELYTLSFSESNFGDYKANVIFPEVEAGRYLDLWQARIARAVGVGHGTDDYVQAYRRDNNADVSSFAGWSESGQNTFFTQDPDPERGNLMPYIYDPEKTGFWAIPENQLAAFMRAEFLKKNSGVMISEGPDRNVIKLGQDGIFEWDADAEDYVLIVNHGGETAGTFLKDILNEGDLINRRILRIPTAARSTLKVFASWETGGIYNTIFVRDLESRYEGELVTDHDIDLANGMTVGVGIFDDNSSNRSHFVSFPVGLVAEGQSASFLAQSGVNGNTRVIQAKAN